MAISSPVRNAQLPQELKDLPQWANLCRTSGKKQPAYFSGTEMKWGTPKNWYTFQQVSHLPDIMFILSPESGIVGVDCDGCVANGVIHPLVQDWIARTGTYVEFSQSGTGVKMLLRAHLPADFRKINNTNVPWRTSPEQEHIGIEIHTWQPFHLTGNIVPGCPSEIRESPEVLNDLLVRFAPHRKVRKSKGPEPKIPLTWDFDAWVRRYCEVIDALDDGYIIGCPWASEHTTMGDTARIWNGPPHTFHCFHSHCAGREWRDVRLFYEPDASTHKEQYTDYRPEQVHLSKHAQNGNVPPTATSFDLCSFDADDAGNSDAMNALYGQDFLYCVSLGWLHYTGTHWSLDSDGAMVRKSAIETLRKRRHAAVDAEKEAIIKCTRADERRVNGCMNLFKTHVSTLIDSFDSSPHLLNCQNGVVDLRTGAIAQHNRAQRFTYCVPVEYGPADCVEWLDYLKGVVGGGQEVIDYLQMALGYSLTGDTREEILFYLFGPPRSGKGTLAEVFMMLLPHPLSTMVDFNSFTAKREGDVSNFDLAPLKPSRLIFASESNRSQSLNPAKIKQLTGGDHISACFKHRDFFSYRPQFKVWMMSNHPVNGDPEDDALWGRVRVIEFPNSFLGKEDKSKKARLKEPSILKGVLSWAVRGAIKWYALGSQGLIAPEAIVKITQSQREALDYVQQWLDEVAQEETDETGPLWTANEAIAASYNAWGTANHVQYPKGPKALAQSLKAKGYRVSESQYIPSEKKMKRGVGGLHIFCE